MRKKNKRQRSFGSLPALKSPPHRRQRGPASDSNPGSSVSSLLSPGNNPQVTENNATANRNTQPAENTSRTAPVFFESPFFSSNQYSALSTEEAQMEASSEPTAPKPPPIFVKNIKNFSLMCTQLDQIAGRDKYSCLSRQADTKISCHDSETYRAVIRYLKDINADFHSYQLREERALRVVIRNLHHTTPTDCIIQELTELGFKPKNALNVLGNRRGPDGTTTKVPLPLFFVDLETTSNVSDIYSVTSLYHTKITVEKPHPRREIIQCHRCQQYGHSKGSCNHPPRCVKCGENHDTRECQKSRDTPAVCALCRKSHPANYRGCETYQQLRRRTQRDPSARRNPSTQRQRDPSTQSQRSPSSQRQRDSSTSRRRDLSSQRQRRPQDQPHTRQSRAPSRTLQEGLTFARAANANQREDASPPQPQRQPHEQPPHRQRQAAISNIPHPSASFDIYAIMESFITQTQSMIKSMIEPLVNLITALISRLPTPLP